MSRYILILIAAFLFLGTPTALAQPSAAGHSFLIIIDGKPATEEALAALSEQQLFKMQFLTPQKAQALYGPAAAKGALLVTSKAAEEARNPVVLLEGQPVSADSLKNINFERIDVVRGQQAINLYGPAAKEGVYLVKKTAPETLNIRLQILNEKGKPVKGAQVLDEHGNVLAKSNQCGIALLENFSKGSSVKVLSKKYKLLQLLISKENENVILLIK